MSEQVESVRVIQPVEADAEDDNHLLGVAKGGGITLVGKTFTNASKFATAFLLARLLGAEHYGSYQLTLNVVTLVADLALLGLDTALMRYVAIAVSRSDQKRTWGTLQIGLGIPLLLSIIASVGVFALSYPVAEQIFHDISLAPLLQLAAVIIPFSSMGDALTGAVRGFKNMRYPVYAKFIIQPILKIILIVGAAVTGLKVQYAIGIFGAGELVAAAMLVYYLNKLFKLNRPAMAAERPFREVLTFTIPDWIAGIMDTFRLNIQSILIGSLSSIAGVGVFAVADQLNVIGHDFYTSINASAKPYIAELHDRGDDKQLERLYQATSKWSLTVNLPFFLLMVLFPVPVLSIFGKSFEGGAIALIIMAWASLVDVGTGMCGAILNMTGYTGLKLANNILSLVLSILINVILIPRWGIVGAAVSALSATLILNLVRIVEVYVIMKILPYNRSFFKPIAAGAITFVVSVLLSQWLPFDEGREGLIQLAFRAALIFAVFIGLVWSMRLSEEDRLIWDRFIGKRFGFLFRNRR